MDRNSSLASHICVLTKLVSLWYSARALTLESPI